MDLITKDFPVLAGDATDDYPHGSFEVILSAPTLDRDGEIIDSRAFEPLPARINFDTDHSMTCDSVVGSGVPFYDEAGNLRVKGGFARDDRSQMIRMKVADGHIDTTSVTFMAAKRETDEKGIDHVTKAELLNGTFTPVPSNREAVVLTAKSIVAKAGARNSATDLELIQSAHDAMSALGAACGKSAKPTDVKSIAGSLEAAQDRVRDALQDRFCDPNADPTVWVWLRGVLPDYCVFEMSQGGVSETYRIDYTDDGSVTTLTGDPVLVDVLETVVPDADADTEPEDVLKSAADAADPAAPAAGSAADAADPQDVELRALFAVNENAARFAFDL
jgi:hypothetical protein